MNTRRVLLLMAFWVGAVLAGCGESEQLVQISYDRAAKVEIPATIQRIAIAEFTGQSARDKRWGDIASDELAAGLEAENRKHSRYELVDRKRLKEIMDERDLQMAISDSSSAAKIGKLANVQAIVYGNVQVNSRDEKGTKMVPDFSNPGAMKQVSYTKRYCLVTVSFTMDDINTGKMLTAETVKKEYDSDKANKQPGAAGLAQAIGLASEKLDPADQAASNLLGQAVEEFIARISPHSVRISEKLEKGKSEAVKNGNTFAAAKSYEDALRSYQRAIQLKPDDDGAMFNAGLVCEAMGDLKKAEGYYQQALDVKVKSKYIEARDRVRAENKE